MGTGDVLIVIIVAVVAAVSTVIYLKVNNKIIGEKMTPRLKKDSKAKNVPQYTDKDRDMMELIHELSIVYENTDNYLSNNISPMHMSLRR